MKLELNIEDDSELKKAIHGIVAHEVRKILKEDGHNLITTEIGKLRMLNNGEGSTTSIHAMINKAVADMLSLETANLRGYVGEQLKEAVKDIVRPAINDFKDSIQQKVDKAVRELLGSFMR